MDFNKIINVRYLPIATEELSDHGRVDVVVLVFVIVS